jgi:hypothetical protein
LGHAARKNIADLHFWVVEPKHASIHFGKLGGTVGHSTALLLRAFRGRDDGSDDIIHVDTEARKV